MPTVDVPEETFEIAPGATVQGVSDFAPPVTEPDRAPAPVEEGGHESNNVNDVAAVAVVDPYNVTAPEVGQFVGFDVSHITVAAGEWTVDPSTGCITGPA